MCVCKRITKFSGSNFLRFNSWLLCDPEEGQILSVPILQEDRRLIVPTSQDCREDYELIYMPLVSAECKGKLLVCTSSLSWYSGTLGWNFIIVTHQSDGAHQCSTHLCWINTEGKVPFCDSQWLREHSNAVKDHCFLMISAAFPHFLMMQTKRMNGIWDM